MKGRIPINKGKSMSEEQKIKISVSKKGKKLEKVTCPNCGIGGAGPNMTRYHFKNCKTLFSDLISDPK